MRDHFGFIVIAILVVVGIIGGIIFGVSYANSDRQLSQTCHITSKDRSSNSDGDSIYRVYTSNCGVFEVSDTIIFGRFDSADRYNTIEVNKDYYLIVAGWRVHFLSMFPNILGAQPA